MTTPKAQYIEQPEPEDFFDHLEKVTYDLDAERISHGLTRGILLCARQPEPAGEAVYFVQENTAGDLWREVSKEEQGRYGTIFHRTLYTHPPAAAPAPAFNGWYCAHCQRGVDGSEVTYHEQHTVCGRVITDDVPPAPAPAVPTVELLQDKIASMLHGTYHCNRVWAAWAVGTMSEDDFEPVDESDTPREIAEEIVAMLAATPVHAPAQYKDSTPHLSVGESSFESWFESYDGSNKGDKQRARDAYAAGMGDPLVMAKTAQEVGLTDGVVGYRVSLPDEPDLGFWFSEDPNLVDDGHLFEPLVLASTCRDTQDLSDEEWQTIADETGCIITGHLKEAIIAALRAKGQV